MKDNYTSNPFKNDEFSKNHEECDYQNLITILKEISATIALLKKNFS
tara:strand:+ start:181 stop:321 length:141 start_codon:yes stop_codon:yes gene_type:complete